MVMNEYLLLMVRIDILLKTMTTQEAIFTLMASQHDYVVRIVGPAFQEPGCLHHDSVLELREIGYSNPQHEDGFEVVYNGKVVAKESDLNAAIQVFMKVREEKEVGHDFAEIGHAGSLQTIVEKPKITDLELYSWVCDTWNTLGMVVANGDWPGWYRIWFGSGEIVHMPIGYIYLADAPPEVCRNITPVQMKDFENRI